MFALGLGIVLGAAGGFPAGKHYALFKREKDLAMDHWGRARRHWSTAAGPVGLLALLLVGGIAIMIFGG